MSNRKPPEKQPERTWKVGGQTVTYEQYRRFQDEIAALKIKESQMLQVCRSQNGNRRW